MNIPKVVVSNTSQQPNKKDGADVRTSHKGDVSTVAEKTNKLTGKQTGDNFSVSPISIDKKAKSLQERAKKSKLSATDSNIVYKKLKNESTHEHEEVSLSRKVLSFIQTMPTYAQIIGAIASILIIPLPIVVAVVCLYAVIENMEHRYSTDTYSTADIVANLENHSVSWQQIKLGRIDGEDSIMGADLTQIPPIINVEKGTVSKETLTMIATDFISAAQDAKPDKIDSSIGYVIGRLDMLVQEAMHKKICQIVIY